MTQEKTRYDALGRLTAIEVGAVVGFAYGYVPMEDNIETMTFTHRANDPPYRNHRLTIRMRGR